MSHLLKRKYKKMILANKQHTSNAWRPLPPHKLRKHGDTLRTRFFVSYYIPDNKERVHEIDTCLFFNVSNPQIDEVFVLCDVTTPLPSSVEPYIEKITKIDYPRRVLIKDMIEIVNKHSSDNIVNIFGNSDIIFDEEGLQRVREYILPTHAFALSRKNLKTPIDIHTDRRTLTGSRFDGGATDTWIIRGTCIIPTKELNIHFGTLGCDPLLNSILATKYTILQPTESVPTYHYHLSQNTNNYYGPNILGVKTIAFFPTIRRSVLFE
jgi:hypothetical protein